MSVILSLFLGLLMIALGAAVYLGIAWVVWYCYAHALCVAITALPVLSYWQFVGCWVVLSFVLGMCRAQITVKR